MLHSLFTTQEESIEVFLLHTDIRREKVEELKDEKRVLYLDPDIIVNGSLRAFYHMDFEGAQLAAARDRPTGTDHVQRLQIKHAYVNSGMLLMNLEKMRERGKEELLRLLDEKKEELQFPDQDLINLFWTDLKQVEDAYNISPKILYLKEYLLLP